MVMIRVMLPAAPEAGRTQRINQEISSRQTRTKVLNSDLEGVFRGWYPQFHARAA